MAEKFLQGISLENFRAIGARVFIGPFADVNFFIGPNNAGKSTVLLFLARYLHPAPKGGEAWGRSFSPNDVHLSKHASQVNYAVGVTVDGVLEELQKRIARQQQRDDIRTVVEAITRRNNLLWLEPDSSKRSPQCLVEKDGLDVLSGHQWSVLSNLLTNSHGGNIEHWKAGVLRTIAQLAVRSYPSVHLIPAIREISEKGEEFKDYSGKGLIDRLAELQNPPHDERHLRDKFDAINVFLRSVTESSDATIEVPHDRRYILVHMDGKVLPLSSLGTGIHEVVMLASFCTLLDEKIVCVEEPEIHLHPLLQRKLVRYLREKTSNQYFIATHSASVIDAVPASIFSVTNDQHEASFKLSVSPKERHEICRSLGYAASDLLQANAIVWVEGPSDRIYINHWLRSVAPELVEGIDYSIMFYGGRLLSHLSANDPEVNDFISLRRLNRNIAIVIDSDRATARTPLNKTKERVVRELDCGFAWVTKGREIENYLASALLGSELAAMHKEFGKVVGDERFDHRLHFIEKRTGAVFTKVDKVKVARRISRAKADLSQLDLKSRIEGLVAFIRGANLR